MESSLDNEIFDSQNQKERPSLFYTSLFRGLTRPGDSEPSLRSRYQLDQVEDDDGQKIVQKPPTEEEIYYKEVEAQAGVSDPGETQSQPGSGPSDAFAPFLMSSILRLPNPIAYNNGHHAFPFRCGDHAVMLRKNTHSGELGLYALVTVFLLVLSALWFLKLVRGAVKVTRKQCGRWGGRRKQPVTGLGRGENSNSSVGGAGAGSGSGMHKGQTHSFTAQGPETETQTANLRAQSKPNQAGTDMQMAAAGA